jgi:hypothetical protein
MYFTLLYKRAAPELKTKYINSSGSLFSEKQMVIKLDRGHPKLNLPMLKQPQL